MKKIAIIYTSKYGTTEKVAKLLADKLEYKVTLISLKQNNNPDIDAFDTIILGTSIYAGSPRKEITKFCKKNQNRLLEKTIGLFICGMQPGMDVRNKQIVKAYPEPLRQHAKIAAFLGGEFQFEKMNFLEKFIAKKASKVTNSVSSIDYSAIEEFVKELISQKRMYKLNKQI